MDDIAEMFEEFSNHERRDFMALVVACERKRSEAVERTRQWRKNNPLKWKVMHKRNLKKYRARHPDKERARKRRHEAKYRDRYRKMWRRNSAAYRARKKAKSK